MNTVTRKRRSKFERTVLSTKYTHSKKVLAILQALHPDEYGSLSSQQIYQLFFQKGSKSYCDEVLKHLFHKPLALVNRHALFPTIGLNNATIAYTLTTKGSKYLTQHSPKRPVTAQKTYKLKNNTNLYREHEKGLNDVRIALVKGAERIGATIESWISDRKFHLPAIRKQLRVTDPTTGEVFGFQPDGFFVLRLKTGERKPFFLEYDNNTMFHKRFRNVKIRGYHLLGEQWRKLPLFAPYKDIPVTYRVLTVVNAGNERAFHLKQYGIEPFFAKDKKKELNSRRYYVAQASAITAETVYTDPIWYIPFRSKAKEQKFTMFENVNKEN